MIDSNTNVCTTYAFIKYHRLPFFNEHIMSKCAFDMSYFDILSPLIQGIYGGRYFLIILDNATIRFIS